VVTFRTLRWTGNVAGILKAKSVTQFRCEKLMESGRLLYRIKGQVGSFKIDIKGVFVVNQRELCFELSGFNML